MTDMRRARLPQGAHADHSICTLSVCVAYCPPPPVARKLSNPSWKVIVSASRGQYLKPGAFEPGFFSWCFPWCFSCRFFSARGVLFSVCFPLQYISSHCHRVSADLQHCCAHSSSPHNHAVV